MGSRSITMPFKFPRLSKKRTIKDMRMRLKKFTADDMHDMKYHEIGSTWYRSGNYSIRTSETEIKRFQSRDELDDYVKHHQSKPKQTELGDAKK